MVYAEKKYDIYEKQEIVMEHLINKIRFYHFISAVILNQQTDPLCLKCKAFANTVLAMREDLGRIETGYSEMLNSLTDEISLMYREALDRIFSVRVSEDVTGQKTAGNCKMPKGVCFVKSSKAIIGKI